MAALSTDFLGHKLLHCPQLPIRLLLCSRSPNRLSAEATSPRAGIPRCEGQYVRSTVGRIHGRSEESIRVAFERSSSQNRKGTKINLESSLKKLVEETLPWVKRLFNFVEFDQPSEDIVRRLLVFGYIGYWSIANSRELMIPLGLIACIYFLNKRMRSLGKAAVIGLATLFTFPNCGFGGGGTMGSLVTLVCLFLCGTFLR